MDCWDKTKTHFTLVQSPLNHNIEYVYIYIFKVYNLHIDYKKITTKNIWTIYCIIFHLNSQHVLFPAAYLCLVDCFWNQHGWSYADNGFILKESNLFWYFYTQAYFNRQYDVNSVYSVWVYPRVDQYKLHFELPVSFYKHTYRASYAYVHWAT